MFVLCVVSKDKKAKCRIFKTKKQLQMKYRVQENKKNSGGGTIFCTCPDHPWGSPSLIHSGYQVSFPRVKRLGHGVNYSPPSSAEVKGEAELYFYSHSGPP